MDGRPDGLGDSHPPHPRCLRAHTPYEAQVRLITASSKNSSLNACLHVVQLRVDAAPRQQCVVGSLLSDASLS